jgi:DNA polymerase-3 subunit beta
MKFSITQSEFAEVIQTVIGTVPSKSTLPVLSTLLVEASGGRLTVTATDLDISVRTGIGCEVLDEGRACLPARRLSEIVRELPSDKVEVTIEQDKAVLKCGKGQFKLMGVDPEDYPKLPEVTAERQVKLGTDPLRKMIRKCIYAVSNDETRPMLNGVLVELGEGTFGMVATDGHRLAYVKRQHEVGKGTKRDIIVPPKALNQVLKLASEEEVQVGFAKNYAVFEMGKTTVYCRLLEGPFPDYRQVIPSEHPKKATLSRSELVGAIRRVSVLADQATKQIKLGLRTNAVEVATRTADVGEATEEVPAQYGGEELEVGFNANYLLDSLGSMEADEVTLAGNTAVSASVLWPADQEEGEELICLVMPVRLPEEVPVA